MKNPTGRAAGMERAVRFAGLVVVLLCTSTSGQVTNSWINPTSGNWEDATSWSLGVPPGTGQTVLVENHGWKAVSIGNNTAVNFPQTMSIDALRIISPGTDTVNTVLLNYAGVQTPLTVAHDLEVSNSTAMVVLQSAIQANGGLFVDGTLTEDASSQVSAPGLEVSGAYYLTNSTLSVPHSGGEDVYGHFVQAGGSNSCGAMDVTGEYDLIDGQLVVPPPGAPGQDGVLVFGNFIQSGGTMSNWLSVGKTGVAGGTYRLDGGFLQLVSLGLPTMSDNGEVTGTDSSYVIQTGGTNVTTGVTVGDDLYGDPSLGLGTYILTNGLLVTSAITINGQGNFYQYGGVHSNASLTLSQSELTQPSTNYFVLGHYYLNGGTFTSDSVIGQPGVFSQTAGLSQITSLQISGGLYSLSGGQVNVSDIALSNSANFVQSGGTVTQSGTLTLAGAGVTAGPGTQQFGQLLLAGNTNSTLTLSPGASALHFANSSSLAWAGAAALVINNWNGSLTGGGAQQIFFGSDITGLTAQQLSQVQFSNPPGLSSGTYAAQILSDGEVVPNQASSSSGPVNSWTNSASGDWDQPTNWSLGVLPNSSQSVLIANAGSKVVTINPFAPANFPDSLTVSNLMVEGASNTVNTLSLSNFGTNVPLTVLNGLTLQNNGQLLNLNSGLMVQGGTLMVTNSNVGQNGGFVRATNGPVYLSGSQYNITNGLFEAGSVSLGYPVPSHFSQYGGSVMINSLGFSSFLGGTNRNGYSLYGGTLDAPGGMDLYGEPGGASYFQSGGTNRTGQVTVEVDYGGSNPSFELDGGLLADSGVLLYSGYKAALSITQNGGSHMITNTLVIRGSSANGYSTDPATYYLNGGTLSAGTLELNADEGDSVFNQTNATVSAGTVYAHSVGYYGLHNTTINLLGGTLSCLNYTNDDGGGQLNQNGGAVVVSNLLDFSGSRNVGIVIYGRYTFTGGTVAASNINLAAEWFIGDGNSNRISNPGTFSLAHLLVISNAVEQLGHFILTTNATNAIIDLAGSASRLSFLNSSGEPWASGAMLIVSNWNGNPSGGGAEQLKFGTDESGLTPAQLNQIQFQIGTNSYSAKILGTGEVVPGQAAGTSVAFSQQGSNLVLTWPAGWTLQSATNAFGPYNDVTNVTSPYTNDMTLNPQLFFRLKQ